MKSSSSTTLHVDAAALQLLERNRISGISFPYLVDCVTNGKATYMLSTFIEGDNVSSTIEHFSPKDWKRLAVDVGQQLLALRQQTSIGPDSPGRPLIATAAGGIINDPRVSWIAEQGTNPKSAHDFLSQVWIGLDLPHNRNTIRPIIQPLVEIPVPIVFCHGDVYPRNMIFPGGLNAWREGKSRICLIDWEFSGWMPAPWEAIKATWIECDQDTEWMLAMRDAMPEFTEYMDVDWLWRSKSNIMLI